MMNRPITVFCTTCGQSFQTTRTILDSCREARGCFDDDVECPGCEKRWAQGWDRHMSSVARKEEGWKSQRKSTTTPRGN